MRLLAALLLLVSVALPQDGGYDIPLTSLILADDAALPKIGTDRWFNRSEVRVVVDGNFEAYVGPSLDRIVVERRAGESFTGTLFIDDKKFRFKAPATPPACDQKQFELVRDAHMDLLLNGGNAGMSYWRQKRGHRTFDEQRAFGGRGRRSELASTFGLLTGGRALQENLQLDRGLPGGRHDEQVVEVAGIRGVTVERFDWTEYLKDAKYELDPLAEHIPADQYALFFRSFASMTALMDLAETNGAPVIQAMEAKAVDHRIRERYEQMLCLRSNALSRLLGPKLIASIAVTGSDPLLREGTDLAVVFEAKDADTLEKLLAATRVANAGKIEFKTETINVEGVACTRIVSKNRRVDSIQFRRGNVIVVTNSMKQARKLIATNRTSCMGALDEYKFFRSRYKRTPSKGQNESAFLMITDDAIRRWSGPRWRIAMSRRVRAHAALGILDIGCIGKKPGDALANDFDMIDLGKVTVTDRGAASSIYGSAQFLRPVSELAFTHATKAEAESYERWRDGYESNWSNFFDPIGVQIRVSDTEIFTDVTVMPLIVGSQYQRWIRLAGESKIKPGAGRPHDGTLFQMVAAFDHDSEAGRAFQGVFTSWPGVKPRTNPLAWVGQTISIAFEDGKLLHDALQSEDPEEHVEKNLAKLPVVLHIDVESPLLAAVFLTGLRTLVEGSAPGYTEWSTHEYGEVHYVRVAASKKMQGQEDALKDFAIYYATLKGVLIIGVDPVTFKAAIDRHQNGAENKHVWLGDHLAGRVRRDGLAAMEALAGKNGYRAQLRRETYKNLPILNEWKRLYPSKDAVKVHERITGERLVCAAGGKLVWNAEWQTYESSVFGHSGVPKRGPDDVLPFQGWKWGNFGVTFEKDGIRARASITK